MTREDRIAEILGVWYAARDAASPLDPEDLIRSNPDLETELRDHFRLMDAVGATLTCDAPAAPSRVPEQLGPFLIHQPVGTGGMGTVYLAETVEPFADLEAGRQIALKVMHPHLFRTPGFYRRFLREGELGREIRQENVVRTLAVGSVEHDGMRAHFLVMDFVQGQTLRELQSELDTVPEGLCRSVGSDVLRALEAIHAHGAVHRDVKPENIVITPDHSTKLMDLGVAHLGTGDLKLSKTGSFVGSVLYAAPEQFGRPEPDARADLYALGLVLYEIATGEHPLLGDDPATVMRRQINEVPRPAAELNPQLSPFFNAFLASLLEKDPERRPSSASAARQILADGEDSEWWRERRSDATRGTGANVPRMRVQRTTRMYGRDEERQTLDALLGDVRGGDGRALLIEGEAGVGKTRLVEEFLGSIEDRDDVQVLWGTYEPFAVAAPWQAYRGALLARFDGHDLESALAPYLQGVPRLIPSLASALRGEEPPPGHAPLDAPRLVTVLVHLLRGLAREQLVVLVVDDLHYASEEAHRLFVDFARAVSGHRILLIGTHRRGSDAAWVEALGASPRFDRLPLRRLGAKDLANLLREAFGSAGMAEELSYQIALKSDGNPFFAFEMIDALKEGGFIHQRPDGAWVTSQVDHTFELPGTIADLIRVRFEGLSRLDREILDVAACDGSVFDPGLVAEVLGVTPLECLRRLSALERERHLLRSEGRRFAFDHPQIREVLWEQLIPSLREAYHGQFATLLRTRHGEDSSKLPADLCQRLAHHLLEAGRAGDAIPLLRRFATQSRVATAGDAPSELLERALDHQQGVSGKDRAELLFELSTRLYRTGDLDRSRECSEEGLRLAEEGQDPILAARFHRAIGSIDIYQGRPADAVGRADRMLELARASGDIHTRACAHILLGDAAYHRGDHQSSVTSFQTALDVMGAEPQHRMLRAASLNGQAIAYELLSEFESAEVCHEEQVRLRREANEVWSVGVALGNLGTLRRAEGRYADAERYFRQSLAHAREWGNRPIEARQLANLGVALYARARLGEALVAYRSALQLFQELGSPYEHGNTLLAIAVCLHTLGDLGAAEDHVDRVLELAKRHYPLTRLQPYAWGIRAALAAERGDHAEAGELYTLASDRYRASGEIWSLCGSLLNLGEVAWVERCREDAMAHWEEAESLATTHHVTEKRLLSHAKFVRAGVREVESLPEWISSAEECMTRDNLVGVCMDLYRGTGDALCLQKAKDILDDFVGFAPEKYRESMLTNVKLHREITEAWAEHGVQGDAGE